MACLLLCGTKAALAADWSVTYTYGAESLPVSDTGKVFQSGDLTKTKTVTVTAKMTWTGTGAAPKRVKVKEVAVLSWHGSLAGPTVLAGQPPIPPSGSMSGADSQTGLTDVAVKDPNPWTDQNNGEIITGTREETCTVPDNGILDLPTVTLTAKSRTTTGSDTTGKAWISIDSYTVTIPDGKASATSTITIAPSSGWTAGMVEYGTVSNSTYARDMNTPTITVSVGYGVKKQVDLDPVQRFTYTFPTYEATTSNTFTAEVGASVSGLVSAANPDFYAESLASFDETNHNETTGSDIPPIPASLGFAPRGAVLTYSDTVNPATFSKTSIADSSNLRSYIDVHMHLRAMASTTVSSGRQITSP